VARAADGRRGRWCSTSRAHEGAHVEELAATLYAKVTGGLPDRFARDDRAQAAKAATSPWTRAAAVRVKIVGFVRAVRAGSGRATRGRGPVARRCEREVCG